jgi:cobalt transporter subunit CbtA
MKTLITPALQAGFLAALILTLVQMFTAVPLILEAETYEQAAEPVAAAPATHTHEATTADAADHHSSAAAEWEPENGWQRTLSTTSANVVMGVGYALILMGLFRFRAPKNVLTGLAWGSAGYLSMFVAPSLGLHPELPGTAAAELVGRQEWWVGTVLATATGIGLCALTCSWALRAIGIVLLAMPHLIGAPQPAVEAALAPETLQHQFVLMSAIVNAVFWLVLGTASAWFYGRANRNVSDKQPSANTMSAAH